MGLQQCEQDSWCPPPHSSEPMGPCTTIAASVSIQAYSCHMSAPETPVLPTKAADVMCAVCQPAAIAPAACRQAR